MPERFDRLLVMNTSLAVGASPGPGFDAWKAYNRSQPDLDIAALMSRASPILTPGECAAYAAPFPDRTYKAGVRRFPELVMVSPDMEGVDMSNRAARWWSTEWAGQSFMAIGEADPVLGVPAMNKLRQLIANCPEPMLIEEAGHFVQEWGVPIANAALRAFGDR
jgi:pimeloyl-ACP methyl ester carboxylesterase